MRPLFRLLFISLATVVSVSACTPEQGAPQDGDIVFFESTSQQSPVIKLAQHSKWTDHGDACKGRACEHLNI